MIIVNKVVTLLFWLLAAIAWFQGWQGWLGWLPSIALAVAAIHVLEVAYFAIALKDRSDNVVMDALQIMVFGMFHMQRFINVKSA